MADVVSSLILGRTDLRGFCFTPLISPLGKGGYEGGVLDYQQKNPLKYYTRHFKKRFQTSGNDICFSMYKLFWTFLKGGEVNGKRSRMQHERG